MLRGAAIFSLMFGALTLANAQTGTLNQLDAAGKKNGKWIIYLNKYWKEVKDSNKAVYSRYDYFDHGYDIYPVGQYGKKKWILENYISNPVNIAKIHLLDGDYKWLDKNSVVRSTHKFYKGEPVFSDFFTSAGKPELYCEYAKKWNGMPYTYLVHIYEKNGDENPYYMLKWNSVWGLSLYGDSSTADTLKVIGDSLFINSKTYYHGKLRRECGEVLIYSRTEQIVAVNMINHGLLTEWYTNSEQKSYQSQWTYGNQIGMVKRWDENGKEIPSDAKEKN